MKTHSKVSKQVTGSRDSYKVEQIDKILNASAFYAYLSGDKTSGALTFNLSRQALEILKAFYEGKKIAVEEVPVC